MCWMAAAFHISRRRTKRQRTIVMRITTTAVLAFLAIAGNTVRNGDGTAASPFPPVASAYVPNNNRRPGYGSAAATTPSPKQNSNGNHNDALPSSSSSAVYYRNTADVYESTAGVSYETVQERIQRVRSGHLSESEKNAYLKSALGSTGNYLDQITAQAGNTAKNAASPSTTTSTAAKAWSHPSYTPPSYITGALGKDAQIADSKRRYLESVMDPNRFQSFGNVGRAAEGGAAVNAGGMSADEAELAAVQAKIARIEEEKKRIAAEAKEKADIEAARHKLQEQQLAEKEREATARLDIEKATLAEKEREAIEKASLAERLTAAAREASNKLGEETASLAERLAAAAEEAELKRQQDKLNQEEQDRILRAERERLMEAEKNERIELARAAEEHFREQERLEEERLEQERIAAEKKAQEEEEARIEQQRIAAEEARIAEEQQLEQERIAAEERAAAEAEEARLAAERLEQERLAAEEAATKEAEEARLAEEQRLANEQAEKDRIEAEKKAYIERLEEQRLADEQAEKDRIEAEKKAYIERMEQARIRDEELQVIADAQREEQERAEAEWYASQEEEQLAFGFDYAAGDVDVDFGAAPVFSYAGEESYFVPTTMEDINIMTYSIVEAMRPLTNPSQQFVTNDVVEQQQQTMEIHGDVNGNAYISEDEYTIPDVTGEAFAPVDASGVIVDDLSSTIPTFPMEESFVQEGEFPTEEPIQFFDEGALSEESDEYATSIFEAENTLQFQDNLQEEQVEMENGEAFISLRERFEINQAEMQRLAEEQAAAEEEARIQAEKDRVEAERLAAEKAEQERIEAERRLVATRLQAIRVVTQVAENVKTRKMNDRSRMRRVPDPGFFGTPQTNSLFQTPSENALDEGLALSKEVANALKQADDAIAHANDEAMLADKLSPKEQVKRVVQTATETTSKVAKVAAKGSIFLGGAATIGALQLGATAAKKAWTAILNNKDWDLNSFVPPSAEEFDMKQAQVDISDALRRAKKACVSVLSNGKDWDRSSLVPPFEKEFDIKQAQAEIGDALKKVNIKQAQVEIGDALKKVNIKQAQVEIGDALTKAKEAWVSKYGGKPRN